MAFVALPFILAVLFILYVAYLYFWKKDLAGIRAVLRPGLFFITLWLLLYLMIFR